MLAKPQHTLIVPFCEQQRHRGRRIPFPSYKAKVEPRQEVVVWRVCVTVTVTVSLALALGKEKENKDDKVKGALGKPCLELQCHS